MDNPQVAYIAAWFQAFALTQMVELVVHANAPSLTQPLGQRLAIGFGASAITHPLVWFVIPPVVTSLIEVESFQTEWWIAVAVAEAFAFTAEAIWLRSFGATTRDALATSFFANLSSFSIGLFCYRALAW